MKNEKDTFNTLIRTFEHSFDLRTVFDDFLTLSLCAFGQIPGAGKSYDEELYLSTISKYSKSPLRFELPKLLTCLVNEMTTRLDSSEGWDVLGEFYETTISSKGLSQFFTPWPICFFMAQCACESAKEVRKNIEEPLRILDPACGSGRTLLAASRVAGPHEEYFGVDIDATCTKMTALNLFLSGLFHTETMNGNALAYDDFRMSYQTKLVPFGVFRNEKKECSKLFRMLQNSFETRIQEQKIEVALHPTKVPEGSQLTFF